VRERERERERGRKRDGGREGGLVEKPLLSSQRRWRIVFSMPFE